MRPFYSNASCEAADGRKRKSLLRIENMTTQTFTTHKKHSGKSMVWPMALCSLLSAAPSIAKAQSGGGMGGESPTVAQQTPLLGVVSSTQNPLQIATLHWYNANQTTSLPVGAAPTYMAFDGSDIWVTNLQANTVTKLRVSDGTNLGSFAVGSVPVGVAFDGSNIWVANEGDGTVTKLRASDGANLGSFRVGLDPIGVAFDGASVWVANEGSNTITKLDNNGNPLLIVAVGTGPIELAFDGTNMWVSNFGSNSVTKVRASNGAVLGTFPVGHGPHDLTFDGTNIWVTNEIDNTVTEIKASSGALVATHAVGSFAPQGLVYDGAIVCTFKVGASPVGVAFEGANVWVANQGANTVSKL